jgi:hypothetical protein
MLSGGEALENYAVRNASSVLHALAKRMPSVAHRKRDSAINDVARINRNLSDSFGECLIWLLLQLGAGDGAPV